LKEAKESETETCFTKDNPKCIFEEVKKSESNKKECKVSLPSFCDCQNWVYDKIKSEN